MKKCKKMSSKLLATYTSTKKLPSSWRPRNQEKTGLANWFLLKHLWKCLDKTISIRLLPNGARMKDQGPLWLRLAKRSMMKDLIGSASNTTTKNLL